MPPRESPLRPHSLHTTVQEPAATGPAASAPMSSRQQCCSRCFTCAALRGCSRAHRHPACSLRHHAAAAARWGEVGTKARQGRPPSLVVPVLAERQAGRHLLGRRPAQQQQLPWSSNALDRQRASYSSLLQLGCPPPSGCLWPSLPPPPGTPLIQLL